MGESRRLVLEVVGSWRSGATGRSVVAPPPGEGGFKAPTFGEPAVRESVYRTAGVGSPSGGSTFEGWSHAQALFDACLTVLVGGASLVKSPSR